MQFPNLDPVALRIGPFGGVGPFELRWYALAYIAGLLLGWRYIVQLINTPRLWGAAKPPMTAAQTDDLLFWATIGVILGGRLGYVLFYMLPSAAERARIADDPLTILRIWEGGMAFHGGLIGVILAILWFAYSRKASLLSVGDSVAAAAPIGLFFGRIANFVNGELWGRPADVPWAMVFPHGGPEARHPSQVYEAVLEGLLLFIVLRVATHRFNALQRPGLTTGLFLVGYGLARASLEQVREPDAHMPEALQGYVTMGLLLSLPMIAFGAWLIWRARNAAPQSA
ncbi:MAG: prolipoprotein diacylglyceryl transferase [Alphaproteobacteria bacterium]|nr:prolipoprotein diacylglyceryl transferase [Alphaproteobacteria bacterium]